MKKSELDKKIGGELDNILLMPLNYHQEKLALINLIKEFMIRSTVDSEYYKALYDE